GLRIGEALALKHSDFSDGFRVLRVNRSLWKGKEQSPKTENAVREVDLHPWLAAMLSTPQPTSHRICFQLPAGNRCHSATCYAAFTPSHRLVSTPLGVIAPRCCAGPVALRI